MTSVDTIKLMLEKGCSISVDAIKISADSLAELAVMVHEGEKLIIRNASNISKTNLDLLSDNKGRIEFQF
jgi:hypothetical protein